MPHIYNQINFNGNWEYWYNFDIGSELFYLIRKLTKCNAL